MGQTKSIDLPEPGARSGAPAVPSQRRWWLWVVVLGVVALGGWYYHNLRSASRAGDPAAPTAANKGKGGFSAGNFVVPVVVATAQRGDLPFYFNRLATLPALTPLTR